MDLYLKTVYLTVIFMALLLAAPFVCIYCMRYFEQRHFKRQQSRFAQLKKIASVSFEVEYEQLLKNIPPYIMQMYREDFAVPIDYAGVYFYDEKSSSYKLFSFKTRKPNMSLQAAMLKTDPIPAWFMEKAPYFIKQNLLEPRYAQYIRHNEADYIGFRRTGPGLLHSLGILKSNMNALGAGACVSCFYKDKLQAFLLLGKKTNGSYSRQELDAFTLLARDIAVAVRSGELREELQQSYLDAIYAIISALEEKDAYTKGHSERVVKYSVAIAEELKDVFPFTKIVNFIDKVRRAALLHDVGKIGVPDSILLKPGKLTKKEFEMIKRHPEASLNILSNIRNISEEVREGIQSHHEKHDGTGYRGTKGHRVPPIARIIAIADAFDAMTSDRSYRKAIKPVKAVKEVLKFTYFESPQWDPVVVDAFIKTIVKDPASGITEEIIKKLRSELEKEYKR